MNTPCKYLASAVLSTSAALFASSAGTAPITAPSWPQNSSVQAVQWPGDWNWGRPSGYDGYVYPGYGYGYPPTPTPGYDYAPAAPAAPGYAPGYATGYQAGAADVAYCMRRYRSYDPTSATYIGRDRRPHPCP
jgi:hypothetical protein